jgi:hypothetical protein
MVKWLIPSMTSIVVEAIARIRAITDEARQAARWYETHPEELYHPEDLEYLRHQECLTIVDVTTSVPDLDHRKVITLRRGELTTTCFFSTSACVAGRPGGQPGPAGSPKIT